MTTSLPSTLGVILAGGLSRRMGGGDKGLRILGGKSLIEHVIERIRPQVSMLVLNANGDPERFAAFNLPVIADSLAEYPGPLAGILAALDYTAETYPGVDWVISVTADGPFLPSNLAARLHAAREAAQTPLACAASGGFTHPTIALWLVALRHDLRKAMSEEGLRKIDRWTARHGCADAEWPSEPLDPFFNANTPEELAEAEAMLAARRV